MFAYIVRRLFLMLVTLFGISVIIFVLLRIVPGNIVDILFAAAGYVDPADKVQLQAYITACYGSLTTFNALFGSRDDWFVGAGKEGEEG